MKTTIKFKLRPSTGRMKEGIVTLYVTRNRLTRTLSTKIRLKSEEWDPFNQKTIISPDTTSFRKRELLKTEKELRRIRSTLHREVVHLSLTGDFNPSDLLAGYRLSKECNTLGSYTRQLVRKLISELRFGNAHCYQSALNSFLKFRQGKDISLSKLTCRIMQDYERYLHKSGKSMNTISCYSRTLRAIYNQAIEERLIRKPEIHPFFYSYTSNAPTSKRSISQKTILSIQNLDIKERNNESRNTQQELSLSRDLFMFSFFTQGMSYIDMIYLKKENLRSGYIVYKRQKTKQEIQIKLLPCIKEIISRYSSKCDFLFPVLSDTDDPLTRWKQYRNGLARYNRSLKQIAGLLRFKTSLTGYVARHSWATCAANKGVPIMIISQGMGHESEKTTRIYINNLNQSKINSANRKVLSFLLDRHTSINQHVRDVHKRV